MVKSCIYSIRPIINPYCVRSLFSLVHSFLGKQESTKRRGQISTYVCLDYVWKQQSPFCYSCSRRQRMRDQSSIPSTDVMLLVAFTHWRGQAEFGMTLMCHLDLDTCFVSTNDAAWYLRACVCACVSRFCEYLWLVLRKQENVDLLPVIPHEEASLEGTVQQQKQGHCGWWMAG